MAANFLVSLSAAPQSLHESAGGLSQDLEFPAESRRINSQRCEAPLEFADLHESPHELTKHFPNP
jgi:hypothetical protein